MAKVEHLQTNFTAGEVSPRMYSRVDFARYANSVKSMRNCHGIVTGGAIRRPGTRHLGGLGTSATNIRLVPFQWQDNGYVLVFVSGTSSVQVFKITPTAATLLTTIAVSIADPQSMRISQNGRALYITTGNEFKTITYQNDFAWDVSDFGGTGGGISPTPDFNERVPWTIANYSGGQTYAFEINPWMLLFRRLNGRSLHNRPPLVVK